MGYFKKRIKKKPFAALEIETVDSDDWLRLDKIEAHVYNGLKTFYKGEGNAFKAPFDALSNAAWPALPVLVLR